MVVMRDSSGAALAVGRFAGWEPLGFEAGDNNWYRFVANGPAGKTDPSGLDWLDCMAACIVDNDPLQYALGAAVKVILTSGGWQTKMMVSQSFRMLG